MNAQKSFFMLVPAFSGVPIGNQSVLLKGINNNTETMRRLIHKLLMMRVRPTLINAT